MIRQETETVIMRGRLHGDPKTSIEMVLVNEETIGIRQGDETIATYTAASLAMAVDHFRALAHGGELAKPKPVKIPARR